MKIKFDTITAIIYLISLLAIESFYLNFFFNTGIRNTLSNIPIIYFILIGVLATAASSWNYAVGTPLSRFLESKIEGRRASYKMIARSSLMIFIYCLFLLLPLILTSNHAVNFFFTLTSISQLREFAVGMIYSLQPLIQLSSLSKFVITQISSLTALTVVSIIIGWMKGLKTLL